MGVLLPATPTSTRSTRELCFRISDFLYYYFEQLDQDLPPGRSFYDHMAYSEPESTQDFYPPLLLLLLLPTPSTSTSSRFTAVSTHPSFCYYTAYILESVFFDLFTITSRFTAGSSCPSYFYTVHPRASPWTYYSTANGAYSSVYLLPLHGLLENVIF